MPLSVSLVIPAYNEAECIGPLLAEIPPGLVEQVIVTDNGSTDGTGQIAGQAGATVVYEPRRGYGYACAAGAKVADGDIVAFMDGDGSFVPAELVRLVSAAGEWKGRIGAGFAKFPTYVCRGNAVAPEIWQLAGGAFDQPHLRHLYHRSGSVPRLKRDLLSSLAMQEFTYGWPVEMMVKVARRMLPMQEVPVTFRPRSGGKSKVGGTVRGTALATYRIFRVIFQYSLGSEK